MSEHIPADEVARLAGLRPRAVQAMAATGRVTGAAKLADRRTFRPAAVRAWTALAERGAARPRRSTPAAAGLRRSRAPVDGREARRGLRTVGEAPFELVLAVHEVEQASHAVDVLSA